MQIEQSAKNFVIVGMGLIGGSIAMQLRAKGMAKTIIAVEQNLQHQQQILDLGLADTISPLKDAVRDADIILLAVPVNAALQLLPEIMPYAEDKTVMDVGSTKLSICQEADRLPNRSRFVATHPMWGTEFSGPLSARMQSFAGRAVVFCDTEKSNSDALETAKQIYQILGMHFLYMSAEEHDLHAAYISHVSHISSFALANTVLEKEKSDEKIFEMASGGFESTVRLAKSDADMWLPIFMQNKENVLDVLNEHISQLKKFKSCLEKDNFQYLEELIRNANRIKRILK